MAPWVKMLANRLQSLRWLPPILLRYQWHLNRQSEWTHPGDMVPRVVFLGT